MSEDPIGFEAGDANVRRYVGNSILHFTDPIGLDIYVENTKQVGGLHQRITVDIWDNTGNKIGTLSISFGYDKDRKCGVVYEDLDPPTKEQRRYSTTPEQDAQIRELFLRLLGQTGEYQPIGVGANNCRKFSNTLFREIVRSIRQTGEVPDDTGFEVDPPSPLPIFPKPPRPVFPIKPPNSRPSVPVNPS